MSDLRDVLRGGCYHAEKRTRLRRIARSCPTQAAKALRHTGGECVAAQHRRRHCLEGHIRRRQFDHDDPAGHDGDAGTRPLRLRRRRSPRRRLDDVRRDPTDPTGRLALTTSTRRYRHRRRRSSPVPPAFVVSNVRVVGPNGTPFPKSTVTAQACPVTGDPCIHARVVDDAGTVYLELVPSMFSTPSALWFGTPVGPILGSPPPELDSHFLPTRSRSRSRIQGWHGVRDRGAVGVRTGPDRVVVVVSTAAAIVVSVCTIVVADNL